MVDVVKPLGLGFKTGTLPGGGGASIKTGIGGVLRPKLARGLVALNGQLQTDGRINLGGRIGELTGLAQDFENGVGAYRDFNTPRSVGAIDQNPIIQGMNAFDGAATGLHNVASMAMLPAFIASPVLNGIGGGVKYVGKGAGKIGLPGENALGKVGAAIQTPVTKELGQYGVGRFIVGAVDRVVMRPAAAVVEGLDALTGFSTRRGKKLASSASTQAQAAEAMHADLIRKTTGHGFGDEFTKHLNDIQQEVAKGFGEFEPGKLEGAVKEAQNIAKNAGSKILAKEIKALGKAATRADQVAYSAKTWENLPQSMRNAKNTMSKTSLFHGLTNTLWGATSVTSTYMTARGISQDLNTLREMVADMTGKNAKSISTSDLFLTNLPEAAGSALKLLVTTAGPKAILDVVSNVVQLKSVLGKTPFNNWLIAAQFGGEMVKEQMFGGYLLDTYHKLKQAEKAGEPLSAELVTKVVGYATKELWAKHGGPESKFAAEVGKRFTERGLSVREIMQACVNGGVMQEIHQIQAEAAHAQSVHSAVQQNAANKSFVARVQNQPRTIEPAGKFTEKLANAEAAPTTQSLA